MGVDLYTLRRRAVMVIIPNGKREAAYFLQVAVAHALSQESKRLVDSAVRGAGKEWEGQREIPRLVVKVGSDGVPRPGSPVFEWPFQSRTYCFEHELPRQVGFLGERELRGYLLRTVREEVSFTGFESTQRVNEREARMYKEFCSEEDLFRYYRQQTKHLRREEIFHGGAQPPISFRLTKILGLIRLIEDKGNRASAADLNFLGCLKEKASQLGHFA